MAARDPVYEGRMQMKPLANKKKWNSIKLFLYVLPFLILVFIFSYYPLYGWIYAFYDYRPPRPFSDAEFVGLKWFKSRDLIS